MKIVVMSDIHANAFALENALPEIRRVTPDQIVCLGDAIQGGPQPVETVALLRELACPVVMGNSDDWLLRGEEVDIESGSIAEDRMRRLEDGRLWSLEQLNEADRAFIAAFPPTVEIPLDSGRKLLCFHGSPTYYEDVLGPLTPDEEFTRLLGSYLPSIFTGGHTHRQQIRRVGDDSFFFNPGSVGLAFGNLTPEGTLRAAHWTEYAVLTADKDNFSVDFRRVPYDAKPLIGIYRTSGRPHAHEAEEWYGTS